MAGSTPVPTDPWSAAFMAAGNVAGRAMDDKTNMNAAQSYSSAFDSSGWGANINVGPGASQNAATSADRTTAALGASLNLRNPVVLLAIVAALYYLSRKK